MKRSKLDSLTESAAQDYAHQNTATINSRRRVLECEADEVERAITALTAAISHQRRRKNVIAATIKGLASVVAKR